MTEPLPLSGRQPRTVRRALAVLEEVVAAGPGVTAKEISAALKLPEVPAPPTAARAVLERLRGKVRWGVHLTSLRTGHVVLTDSDPDHPPTDGALLARYPHASALGKLLLAEQPDWRAIARDLHEVTEQTVTGSAALSRQLADIQQTGLARQCGELRVDRGCLAVPVRNPADGALVAGLALCGPTTRVAEPNDNLVDLLREHADRLAPLLA